jgi:hypothetical protein
MAVAACCFAAPAACSCFLILVLRLAPPVDFLVVYGKHNLAIIKTLL